MECSKLMLIKEQDLDQLVYINLLRIMKAITKIKIKIKDKD